MSQATARGAAGPLRPTRAPSVARRDLLYVGGLVAVFAMAVAVTGLGGDYPLNDDWAYAWSARHLATTGEVRILDWAAPSMVTHLAWGAALVKLVGPSYVVLRAGTLAWALLGMLALYGIGRRSSLAPASSLMLVLAVMLSPWYFGLSFTYMTDVPWLTLMLLAFLALLHAERGAVALLVGAGLLLAAAALSRQFALMAMPACLGLIALDARRLTGARWRGVAVGRAVLFAAPVVIAFAVFNRWYTQVHGPTLANRETWLRTLQTTPLHVAGHALATWHYLGLWIFPFVVGPAVTRTLRGQVSSRLARASVVLLLGYALFVFLETYLDAAPALGHNGTRPPQMPFFGNSVYNLGIGAQTTIDVYNAISPFPHHSMLLGFLLTAISTFGAVFAGAFIVGGGRRVAALARTLWSPSGGDLRGDSPAQVARDRARVLLLGAAALHLAWVCCTSVLVLDRYVMVTLPAAIWLALDALPPGAATARPALALVGIVAVFSVAGTHEYLSWNGARDQAVRELETRGVPSTAIDGGFEVNGPRQFADWFARHRSLIGTKEHPWWAEHAHYHISFWPARDARCTTAAAYPYTSLWPWERRAMYVLDCADNPWP